MNAKDVVIPASMQAMYDRFHFAAAVRAGDFLLCSGQLGTGPDGRAIADPAAQFAAAFDAVGTVLAEAGLGFGDVVEMTTFHAGGMQHLGTFMAVRDRYLSAPPYPAWTAIGVVELAIPGALVEIRATAHRAKPPAARATRNAMRNVREKSATSKKRRAPASTKRKPAARREARRR